jgi:hypothetical protein
VIVLKPDFGKIGEAAVFGDVFRRKMAVIVEDRLRSGAVMIESPGDFIREQEILIEERRHARVIAAGTAFRT